MKSLLDREDLIFDPPRSGCVLSLTGLPGGDGKIYDRSPYGNIGTITGATWRQLPSGLWCLSLDGTDDYIDCGTMGSLGSDIGSKTITVEAWVNIPVAKTTRAAVCGVIEDGAATIFQFVINTSSSDTENEGYLGIYIRDEDSNALAAGVDSDTGINDGAWHHLVAVINAAGDSALFYLDALLLTTAYTTQTTPDNTANFAHSLMVGARNVRGTPAYFLKDYIALLRIYNRALSALEIQNLFNQEKHLFGVW